MVLMFSFYLNQMAHCVQEEQIVLYQEKIKAINEKLDISEQKLIEYASMPDIEEQLKDRMEALAAAQVRLYLTTTESFCLLNFFTVQPLYTVMLFSKKN
jgi:hypothetical protein